MATSTLPVLLLVITTYIPLALAQGYDCERYCHDDCSEYFPDNRFSECVRANVHCSCHTKFSFRNPLAIFLLTAGIFVTCFLCTVGYRLCQRHSQQPSEPHRVVAYPVPPAVVGAVTNNRRSSSSNTNNNRSSHAPNRSSHGIVNPLGPQKSNDYPPEYSAPPPYNECVIDINSRDMGEKISTNNYSKP